MEKFGKAAVMLILAAGGLYGSLTMVLQPKMLRTIIENTRETVRMGFSELKSFVKIFTIQDVDSMLAYCGEFVSDPALLSLKEAVQGCDVKQLHDMAKMVREASKKVGRALTEDELVAAVSNWRENGSITKAVQAVIDWLEWRSINGSTSEVFYRKMSPSDYEYLCITGELPSTGETFISPTKSFTSNYDGILVEFEMNKGTTSLLESIGVTNGDRALLAKTVYPDMPYVTGIKWTRQNAFFKAEGSRINIGLGKGKALEIFNRNIFKFKKVE